MVRPLRVQAAGGWYHVVNRGIDRGMIYQDDRDRGHFLELLEAAGERYGAEVHGYVLMGNHYHLILHVPEGNLSRTMQWLNVSYSIWYNRRHGRVGPPLRAARHMTRARAGRIVSIASIVGIIGNAGQCNYSASKAGIIGFTKSLAREIGSRSVTVNAVAPGFIATAMTDVLAEDVKAKLMGSIPLGRLGTAEDVAQAVLFLASPAAAYITGAVLQVDGGMAM